MFVGDACCSNPARLTDLIVWKSLLTLVELETTGRFNEGMP